MASRTTAAVLGAVVVLVTGCAGTDPGAPNGYATPSPPVCDKQTLATLTPGRWTIGTSARAAAPWFAGDRPDNGRGFEAAVAYAVAERLGYRPADVSWVRVPEQAAVAAGPKPFDVGIDLFAHSPQRKRAVDMSSWYYLDRQAVVVLRSSPFTKPGTLTGLQGARFGVTAGSTGELAATTLVRPERAPTVFADADDARRALWRRQIDALVVDLPAAFALVAGHPQELAVAGQLPRTGVPQQFGMVLAKKSPLTVCVKRAVDELRTDGSLLELERLWLVQATGVPELS